MALLNSRVLTAQKESRGMYKADRRLYLDAEGKVVEENDPAKLTLLVHEGGTLPLARAQELGLAQDEDAPSKSVRDQRAAELGSVKDPAAGAVAAEPAPTQKSEKPGVSKR